MNICGARGTDTHCVYCFNNLFCRFYEDEILVYLIGEHPGMILVKSCLQVALSCPPLEDVLMNATGDGFLIKQGSGRCLAVGNRTAGHGHAKLLLDWKDCAVAENWSISPSNNLTQTHRVTLRHSQLCLEWNLLAYVGLVVLTNCSGDENQEFTVRYNSFKDHEQDTVCPVSVMTLGFIKTIIILVTEEPPERAHLTTWNRSLYSVGLIKLDHYDVPCRDVNVTDGVLLNQGPAPFYLHGDVIWVRCDEGFGAKHLDYQREYEVVCSYKLQLLFCSKIPGQVNRTQQGEDEDEEVLERCGDFWDKILRHLQYVCVLSILFLFSCACMFLVVAMILVLLCVSCSYQNKIAMLMLEKYREENKNE